MGGRYREDGTGLPGTNTFNRETYLISRTMYGVVFSTLVGNPTK